MAKCLLSITRFKSNNALFIDKAPYYRAKMRMEAVTTSGGIPLLALRVPVIAVHLLLLLPPKCR